MSLVIGATGLADAAGLAEAKHHKLVDAAQQFEGFFLEEMLKPLGKMGKDDLGAGDGDEGAENGTLQSYGVEAMARAVAAADGLALARQVVAQVEGQASAATSASAGLGQGADGIGTKDLRTGLKSFRGQPIGLLRRSL